MNNEPNLAIHLANLLFSFLLIKFYILLFLLAFLFTEGSSVLALFPFFVIAICFIGHVKASYYFVKNIKDGDIDVFYSSNNKSKPQFLLYFSQNIILYTILTRFLVEIYFIKKTFNFK